MSQDKTYIVVINWNNSDVTAACLESIYACDNKSVQVVVVDNGSEKERLDKLKQWCKNQGQVLPSSQGSWYVSYSSDEAKAGGDAARESAASSYLPAHINHPLVLIECNSNLGFAAGNNVGTAFVLERKNARYIWVLNNDTTIEQMTLPELITVLEKDPSIGAVQSLLLNFNDPAIVDSCGVIFWNDSSAGDDLMGSSASDLLEKVLCTDKEIFGPCQASTLMKVETLKDVGLLDENYFCIFEDADFAFRLRMKGWHPRIALKSITYHKRGLSGKKKTKVDNSSDFWFFLKYRNAIALKVKFWPMKFLLWPIGFFIVVIKSLRLALRRGEVMHTLKIWVEALRFRIKTSFDRSALFDKWANVSLLDMTAKSKK